MCSIIAILLLVVGGLFGVSAYEQSASTAISPQVVVEPAVATAEVVPIPTQAISCAAQDTSQDLAQMLNVVNASVFPSALWKAQTDANDTRTTTTWRADSLGAVAYLEYLHFDCGVSQQQIDDYFSPENFQVILSSYSSYQQAAQCQHNGLKLFEFDLSFSGSSYHMLYWVEQVTPTRVADIALTFPASQQAKQAEYAGRLFPDLPSCERAGG